MTLVRPILLSALAGVLLLVGVLISGAVAAGTVQGSQGAWWLGIAVLSALLSARLMLLAADKALALELESWESQISAQTHDTTKRKR